MTFFSLKMHLSSVIFGVILLAFYAESSFIDPYPRYKAYYDNGDPGEPLYLTQYIEKGDLETARNLSLVHHPDIDIPNYSGYLTVNKEYNSNLFFWFFPAKIDPDSAPVVLWLQGGPGASSLFGLFTENGPVNLTPKGKLIKRKFSWHLNHNLIYIDNPVGAGFSFTDSEEGYAKNEKDVGKNLLAGLQQFFLLFPNLQKNEFFVTGESYGGKYVPAISHAILLDSRRETDDPQHPKINLKGLAIGNGMTDPLHQLNYGDYLYQLGLIDSNGHEQFVEYEKQGITCIKKRDFNCAFDVFDRFIIGFSTEGTLFKNLTGFDSHFNYLRTNDDNAPPLGQFLQTSETRKAIHVGNNSWHHIEDENKVTDHLKLDVMDSVAEWVSELLSNYKVLIYNGQLDIIVAYPLTENYLKHLKFSGADQYKTAKRYIWIVDKEIAGYAKHAGNLTEVLVRNAGHMVPSDQPKWALDMLLRFTTGKGFQN